MQEGRLRVSLREQENLLVSLLLLSPLAFAQEQARACLDKTGLNWVGPFEKALELAKQEKRLLMIKPVAFGTSSDGGW